MFFNKSISIVTLALFMNLAAKAQQPNGIKLFQRIISTSFILENSQYNKAVLILQCSKNGDSIVSASINHSLVDVPTNTIRVQKFLSFGITPFGLTNIASRDKLCNATLVMELIHFRADQQTTTFQQPYDIKLEKEYYEKLNKLLKKENTILLPPYISEFVIRN